MINAQLLLKLVPKYHAWVDATLKRHDALYQPIPLSPRLRSCFPETTTSIARVAIVEALPLFPFADFGLPTPEGPKDDDVNGITYRNTYFLRPQVANREATHFHELIHVMQWQLLGDDLSPLIYALESFANGYRQNFLEVMAYEFEELFVKGQVSLPVGPLVAARLGYNLPRYLERSIKGSL